jgi:hypothetical protein
MEVPYRLCEDYEGVCSSCCSLRDYSWSKSAKLGNECTYRATLGPEKPSLHQFEAATSILEWDQWADMCELDFLKSVYADDGSSLNGWNASPLDPHFGFSAMEQGLSESQCMIRIFAYLTRISSIAPHVYACLSLFRNRSLQDIRSLYVSRFPTQEPREVESQLYNALDLLSRYRVMVINEPCNVSNNTSMTLEDSSAASVDSSFSISDDLSSSLSGFEDFALVAPEAAENSSEEAFFWSCILSAVVQFTQSHCHVQFFRQRLAALKTQLLEPETQRTLLGRLKTASMNAFLDQPRAAEEEAVLAIIALSNNFCVSTGNGSGFIRFKTTKRPRQLEDVQQQAPLPPSQPSPPPQKRRRIISTKKQPISNVQAGQRYMINNAGRLVLQGPI